MLSAKDIAATKVAVQLCNNPELKREILCVPGSDYDLNKKGNEQDRMRQWCEIIVNKKALAMTRDVGLPEELQSKVAYISLLIGLRMITWAEYHEGTLGLSREYTFSFLNSSFFTQLGIIDNRLAAEALMEDENLSVEQRYKLACLYCFSDDIPVLYRQMVEEDKAKFYDAQYPSRIKQQGLVKFWTYYLNGEVNQLKGEQEDLDMYRLRTAVENGSKAAVEYCLEKTKLRSKKKTALAAAAVEAVRSTIAASKDSLIVFHDEIYKDSDNTCIPDDYYADILYFLLSQMTKNQQIKFLKKDIKVLENDGEQFIRRDGSSGVLECFFCWPYDDYWMKVVGMMREFLTERYYGYLLLKICTSIEAVKGKIKDYRRFLREFWCQSPERCKRYIFSNQRLPYRSGTRVFEVKGIAQLLHMLFTLSDFTKDDRGNIELILASATPEEKEDLASSGWWMSTCMAMIKRRKWKILERFASNCFLPKESVRELKRELSFSEEAQRICIRFIEDGKLAAAKRFVKWSSSSAEERAEVKEEMIYSDYAKMVIIRLYLYERREETVDSFLRWCFPSKDQRKTFKKDLIFSPYGIQKSSYFVERKEWKRLRKFIKFCLPYKREVVELKKRILDDSLESICCLLIYRKQEEIYGGNAVRIISKWEEVERYITWCISSEEEYDDYKKKLCKLWGPCIHFEFIKTNQWTEAEIFFSWLGLSEEEIKQMKKDTLFRYDWGRDMFKELMYSREGDEGFIDYGNKQEAIELLLRWYLTDKETVLEFKEHFKGQFKGSITTEEDRAVLEIFDLSIEQRLRDLDEEGRTVKRRYETSTPIAKDFAV